MADDWLDQWIRDTTRTRRRRRGCGIAATAWLVAGFLFMALVAASAGHPTP